MSLVRYCLMAISGVLLLGGTASAQPARQNHIAVSLVAETPRPDAGATVTLALVMKPEPGWHGYWSNPGDAGVAPTIAWRLPLGVEAGPLQFPVPDRLIVSGLMNYVYEHDYAQLVTLRLVSGLAPGTRLPIRGRFDYLACTDRICVPEHAEVAAELVVAKESAATARRAEFDRYRRALPRPLGSQGRFEAESGRVRIGVPLPATVAVIEPYFFPLTEGALRYAAPQSVSRTGDMLVIETEGKAPAGGTLNGVLKIGDAIGLAVAALPGAVPPQGESIGGDTSFGWASLFAALAGALLGGLILNIMPCVFPILSLKALSLARAGGDERSARREALAYAAGVVLTCLALGGALLALRAGGAAVGWAFQLQDPRAILLLLLLVLAVAVNLAGMFELRGYGGGGALAAKSGATGAFWTGALAAFVATPCTGPFMGAALGAALMLPAAAALAVFGGLGLGLALPFLLLGFVPALRRRLPRPGPWMDRLRRILSVPMFLTAAGLCWILWRQVGVVGLATGLAAAAFLMIILWLIGRGRLPARFGFAGAAVAGAAAVLLLPGPSAVAGASAVLDAKPFSAARLASLRAEGRPVFLYFTADWCLTCKVNEAGALRASEVGDAFARKNVAVLAGDWTGGDPAITRFLETQGRSGVPLYLYYPPGEGARILPQLLTPAMLTAL